MLAIDNLQEAITEAHSRLSELFGFVRFCESAIDLAPLTSTIPAFFGELRRKGLSEESIAQIQEQIDHIALEGNEGAEYVEYLHGVAVVKICSILETAVDDVALAILSDREHCRTLPGLSKIRPNKVDLISLFSLTEVEQTRVLFAEMKKEIGSSARTGCGRFETILEMVGLGGSVPDVPSKYLLELLETRHLLVHRSGIVDKKFNDRCPWKLTPLDTRLPIGKVDFFIMFYAGMWYLEDIQRRAQCIFPACSFGSDADADKTLIALQKTLDTRQSQQQREAAR